MLRHTPPPLTPPSDVPKGTVSISLSPQTIANMVAARYNDFADESSAILPSAADGTPKLLFPTKNAA